MPLQFDDVIVDTDTRQLWRAGSLVHISPKAFELLTLLIERRPRPVPKSAIRERLWPGTFVSETNLPTLVGEIRAAIGDDARKPKFVRTLHGLGYAFEAVPHDSAAIHSAVNQPSAWLVAESRQIALYAGENVVGREGTGIIVLGSTTVSRRHARIVIDERGAAVEDLGSKNGTYLNDQRVTAPVPMVDGDQVRTGSLLFTFRLAGPATTTATRASRTTASGPSRR